jgi:mono/diheme cytochrome c family protein
MPVAMKDFNFESNGRIFMRTILLLGVTYVGLFTAGAALGDAGHNHKAATTTASAADAHWMAPADAAQRKNPMAADAASIARGRQLYQANCASCHGAGGKGDGPAAAALKPKPADLTAMAGSHPDGDFAWKIANGRGPMPGWKSVLSEAQIWDTVNFIQSLAPRASGHDHAPGHGDHRH